MRNFTIRVANTDDLPALKHIWQTCFEDSKADTDRFFRYFFGEETTLILSSGNEVAAAAHLLLEAELIPGKDTGIYPAGKSPVGKSPYIYGVGVLPSFRGKGFGAEISRAVTMHCLDLGYEMSVIVPADEGLFDFYKNYAGYSDYFTVNEHKIKTEGRVSPEATVTGITPKEYGKLRERLLSDLNHLRFSRLACSYLNELCVSTGGGLYKLYQNGFSDMAVAAVEIGEKGLRVKELLCSPDQTEYLAIALLNAFGYHSGTVRTPGRQKRFGMSSIRIQGSGYFGFAFD